MITQDDIRRAVRLEQLHAALRAERRGLARCVWVVCLSVLGLLVIALAGQCLGATTYAYAWADDPVALEKLQQQQAEQAQAVDKFFFLAGLVAVVTMCFVLLNRAMSGGWYGCRLAAVAVVLFWLLAAGQCFGATAPPTVYPSCPRVSNRVGNVTSHATGVLVWKSERVDLAQVVTAAHLLDDGVGVVKVACAGGKTYNALVVHVDRRHDFTVLHIRRPLCRVVRFAIRAPVVGARLLLGGYPRGGRFRWHGGALLRIGRDGSFAVRLASEDGDSGGPVLNDQNELVGLISNTTCRDCVPLGPHDTFGPSVSVIAAAAKKYQVLAERASMEPPRPAVSTAVPDT